MSSVHVPDSFVEDMICYFSEVRHLLGEKIFLENFFEKDTVTEEEYLENLGDLHRKAFADSVREADTFLGNYASIYTCCTCDNHDQRYAETLFIGGGEGSLAI